MKKPKSVALIAAGNLADSPVSRLWGLPERLGPVKSVSYRLASRMANSLRAGHAAKDYAEVGDCELILISVPDEMLAATTAELASAGISWAGKAAVIASALLDSSEL